MIKNFKIFKFNFIDLIIILALLIGLTGFFLVKTDKYSTSANIIKEHKQIEFDILIKGLRLTSNKNIFKQDDKAFITIRNVPYTSLDIVKSKIEPYQTLVPNPKDISKFMLTDDKSRKYSYNAIITLKDKAIITDTGPVIGGNKIKIGLPITLEGFKYRLNGIVTDIRLKEHDESNK